MVLKMKNVSLKRDGSWILKNIDWEIKKGEHWVLFGLNGSGKTSLLNLLHAEYFPTSGEITVVGMEFGKTVLGEKLRRKIGLVSSFLLERLYHNHSAFEIVLSGAFASIGLYETPTDEMQERAIGLLKDMGCIEYAHRSYHTLSQGERQRVLIARALMGELELLILDEPANGLDFIAREQLLEAIGNIAVKGDGKGPSIIYVTHHVDEILPCFEKTLLLKKGEVFASGETSALLTSEQMTEFLDLPVEILWHNERPFMAKRMNHQGVAMMRNL